VFGVAGNQGGSLRVNICEALEDVTHAGDSLQLRQRGEAALAHEALSQVPALHVLIQQARCRAIAAVAHQHDDAPMAGPFQEFRLGDNRMRRHREGQRGASFSNWSMSMVPFITSRRFTAMAEPEWCFPLKTVPKPPCKNAYSNTLRWHSDGTWPMRWLKPSVYSSTWAQDSIFRINPCFYFWKWMCTPPPGHTRTPSRRGS
jgi:hypothetical protein